MDIFMRICTQNSDKHQYDKYLREEGVCSFIFLFFITVPWPSKNVKLCHMIFDSGTKSDQHPSILSFCCFDCVIK